MIHAMLAAEPGESVLADLRNLVPKLDPPLGRMLASTLLYGDFVPNHVALGGFRWKGCGTRSPAGSWTGASAIPARGARSSMR